jgi:hypothetical protein
MLMRLSAENTTMTESAKARKLLSEEAYLEKLSRNETGPPETNE